MARRIAIVLALTALALVVIGGTSLSAGGKLDPVKVQATAGKPDDNGKQTITVQLSIEKGWHIYANPVDHEDLDGAQTVVQIKADGKAIKANVKYPAGKAHTEKGIGTFKIYEDKVTIQAELAKASGPLEISVKFQACDEKRCLPTKTVKVNLP
jgi:DsbC/DsbD-like thiol-disulfide interchange protein